MPFPTTGRQTLPATYPKELILKHAIEFIPGRLYLMSTDTIPEQHMNISYVCPEQHFAYLNFHLDFGPNNLGQVIRFCHLINNKFASEAASPSRAICVYSSKRSDHCVNAAFLLTTYMMLAFKLEPTTAIAPISHMMNSYVPYRDAGYGPNTYGITILDCLNGLYKALRIGLLDLQNFNLAEYEFYEKVENGDMNFVTNKFLALATPKVDPGVSYNPNAKYYGSIPVGSASQNKYFPNMRQYVESLIGGSSANTAAAAPAQTPVSQETSRPHTLFSAYRMDDLIRFMQERGVSTIVRLNNRTYPSERFVECYLQHHEMYFPDGTTPTDTILQQFLHLAETTPGPIAVHCKAGLGRTGSLIACYLIKHYQFTTSTVIAFMRLIRPGMVVGPQQNWLQSKEREMLAQTPARPLAAPFSCLKSSTWDQMDIFQPPVGVHYVAPGAGGPIGSLERLAAAGSAYVRESRSAAARNAVETNYTLKSAPLTAAAPTAYTDLAMARTERGDAYLIPKQPRKGLHAYGIEDVPDESLRNPPPPAAADNKQSTRSYY